MSHAIDFDSLEEKLFLLQQIVIASDSYCQRERTGAESDAGDAAFDMYWGWVKTIGTNYLLECAIKTRVFQDYLRDKRIPIDLDAADAQAVANLKLATVQVGTFPLSLREISNKIIHATHVSVLWSTREDSIGYFKYWSGSFALHGHHKSLPWQVDLHVEQWAQAMTRYHDLLQNMEGRSYVGQDWR